MRGRHALGRSTPRQRRFAGLLIGLTLAAIVTVALPAAGGTAGLSGTPGQDFWHGVNGTPAPTRAGAKVDVRAAHARSFRLDQSALRSTLATAPAERTSARAAAPQALVVSLPAPDGTFQRFALVNSPIMEPALAKKHPEIQTYAGKGLDDPAATIRADISPLGFHASVRSPGGAWYIDPTYHLDTSVYSSYYGQDLKDTHGTFVEKEADDAAAVKQAQSLRSGKSSLDVPVGPNILLRSYRLALITDAGYSNYFGGPANVTAAKVQLMNRVDQIYEDETAIRMILIGNNDLLNLNSWHDSIGPNGPCGTAACFTLANITGCSSLARNRVVAGQIVGASAYDIGHLALGAPGGGVANLGVIGRSAKAQGCTGVPTPVGDYYAVDYVAHEMGHQFAGNHTFGGAVGNCGGGNRNNATSVEPGSGSSIMAYAGICTTDDLQPHSDPYWSERSFTEITTYVQSNQNPINEVQGIALRNFGGGNEVQTAYFGSTFSTTTSSFMLNYGGNPSVLVGAGGLAYNAANIQTAINGIVGFPGGAVVTAASASGFTVTFSGAGSAGLDVGPLAFVGLSCGGCFGGIEETNHGGANDSFKLSYNGNETPVITNGGNFTNAGISTALQGVSEVQTVALTDYDVDGDSYTLTYNGGTSVPITRGGNNTAAGIQAAIQGGSEQQTVTLGSFNATTQSFQISYNGGTSATIGLGGAFTTVSNANIVSALTPLLPVGGTVASAGAGNTGFTVTFGGTLANTDVTPLSIVNCTLTCTSSVRESVKGTAGVPGWIANTTVSIGTVTDAGYTVTFNGLGNVNSLSVTNGTGGAAGTVSETTAGTNGVLPAGASATVIGFGGAGNPSSQGFWVTLGGTLGLTNVPFNIQVTGGSGSVTGFTNEVDKGGAVDNKGNVIQDLGNHAPVVTVDAPSVTIPDQTPFALTGSATDSDGDTITYMWEQNDRSNAGIGLIVQPKLNGPLFRQFGVRSDPGTDLMYNAPLNAVTTNPERVFPDLQQILDNNTNAVTGSCPVAGPNPVAGPIRDCFSEFLPTPAYVGLAGTNQTGTCPGATCVTTLHMRLTARDNHLNGGGIGFADSTLTLAPAAGPFLVTSQSSATSYVGGTPHDVTWNVAGTDANGVNAANVKISWAADGLHYTTVLAASTPNDGSQSVTIPNASTTKGRIKVEGLGNVFFDLNDADITVAADTTPPVTTATPNPASPPAGTNGWYLGPVDVTLNATDADSGVAAIRYRVDGLPAAPAYTEVAGSSTVIHLTTGGVHTIKYWSVDVAGNAEADPTITIKIDLAAPVTTATLTPGLHNGWYASPTLTLVGDDGVESGIAHTDYNLDNHGWTVYTTALSGFSTGNHFIQYRSTDNAGRVEAVKLLAFKVDAGKPKVTVTRPADGESFPLDKVVTAAFKCSPEPATESGIDTCTAVQSCPSGMCAIANGANLNTSTVGTHTFTATGTDKAGNQTVVTTHYQVTYTWNGFFSVANSETTTLNLVHAGDLIKVGFGLNGNRGLNIFAAGYPKVVPVACPPDTWGLKSIPAGGAGTTPGLSYGVASGHYTYGWQTSAASAGTCAEFQIVLNDGTSTVHKATFMFFA